MELSEEAKQARREYEQRYRERNREKVRAKQRNWRHKNPSKVAEYNRLYWERKAAQNRNDSQSIDTQEEQRSVTQKRNKKINKRNEVVTQKECPVCGTSITGRRKYCSDACKMKAYRRKK